jgi:hypothetical protein
MRTLQQTIHAPVLVCVVTVIAVLLAAARIPAADWALDSLTAVAALSGATIAAARLALGTTSNLIRGLWHLVFALLLVVAVSEFGGPWIERVETHLGIDDFNDCLVLLAALATLWLTARLDRVSGLVRRLLWIGFFFHLLGTALDLNDDTHGPGLLGQELIQSGTDLFQFLALQFYVLGAVALVTALLDAQVSIRPYQPQLIPLGQRARSDFRRYIVRGSLRRMTRSLLYSEGVRPTMFLIRTAWCLWKFGRAIAATGRPLALQAMDMLRLGWREGIDPILYPTLELYRPERRHWDEHALSRYEIGNGMLHRLHKLRPMVHGARVNLGDKLAFHEYCRGYGLPGAQVLIHASRGRLNWLHGATVLALDCDLFIKPRQWRGARKSLWLRRTGPFIWQASDGKVWTRTELFDHLRRQSRRRDLLLQEMLVNHPSITDLAEQSLIAIRVFTAMDACETPIITHAMLRVISKLEPNWHSKREYAARIDLATGRLGSMCNDQDLWPECWTDRHPVTGAPVSGRVLEAWPQIRALALEAQYVFADRMLVGWDIAVTPSGPVILEGNSYPDVHFLQRAHGQPIGMSALGPVLRRAMDAAQVRDRHMIERPNARQA